MTTSNAHALRVQAPCGALANLALYAAATALAAAAIQTGWTYGYERAGILGALSGVAAVLAVAVSPSLAVAATTNRQWSRAASAIALFVLAGAFSISGALGNAASVRMAAVTVANKAAGDRERQQAAYDAARQELASLPVTRPAGELHALIAAVSGKIGATDCGTWVASKETRAACTARQPLMIELARSERRAHLEAVAERAAVSLSAAPSARAANTDATAIAALIARLGWPVDPGAVTDLLLVIQVLLLELGAGLALAAVSQLPVMHVTAESVQQATDTGTDKPASNPPIPGAPTADSSAADRRQAIIEQLKVGALEGRQADLASALGIPKTTLRRIVESDDRLRMRAMPYGVSRLELVG